MRVLLHDMLTPVPASAFTSMGHEVVGYLPSDGERLSIADKLLQNTGPKVRADVLATNAHYTKGREIKRLMKSIGAPYLLWDLGNEKMKRRTYAYCLSSLQVEGYSCTVLEGINPADFGLNLRSKHNFLVAAVHRLDPLPQKPKARFPHATLDEILDHSKDWKIEFSGERGSLGKVFGNTHLEKAGYAPYTSVMPYLVAPHTLHYVSPSEACAIVGVPVELEKPMIDLMFHKPLLVGMLFSEAPYDMWKDIIDRTIGGGNGH